jgi:hypothetical protein
MSHKRLIWALSQPVAKQGEIRAALDRGEEPPGLSSSESLVLIRLADHHNGKTDLCFPKMETLAQETGYSKTTVDKAIASLRDFGLIDVDPTCAPVRHTRGAEKPVNGYRLHTNRRYGSIPVSGMAPHQPVVHNQEPNLEVPAPPAHGTEPGTAVGSESGTDERVGRARPEGGPPRARAGACAGLSEPPTANGGSPVQEASEDGPPPSSVPAHHHTASSALTGANLVRPEHAFGEHEGWQYEAWLDDNDIPRLVRTSGQQREVCHEPLNPGPFAPADWRDIREAVDDNAVNWSPLSPLPANVRPFRKPA